MEFTLKTTFNASAKDVYTAWLNSDSHSKMTGGETQISDTVGAAFSAWDGYIEGKNVELTEPHTIVQTWRSSDFQPNQEDSVLRLSIVDHGSSTELILTHSNLTEADYHYKKGWIESYFEPMSVYFERR